MNETSEKIIDILKAECDRYGNQYIISIYDEKTDLDEIFNAGYCTEEYSGYQYLCSTCKVNHYYASWFREKWIQFRNNKILLQKLTYECKKVVNGYCSIYDTDDEGCAYFKWEKKIKSRHCSWNGSTGYRSFCLPCNRNFKKIMNHLDNLEALIEKWDYPIDIPRIQSREEFIKNNSNFVEDPKWVTGYLMHGYDKIVDGNFKQLQECDVVRSDWFFNQDIEFLTKLPRLKGVIFGLEFYQDINILKSLPNLQFIKVHECYDLALDDEIRKITYSS